MFRLDAGSGRRTAAALLSAVAMAGLTGCGPKSPSTQVTLNAQDQMVKFAQCLRQQGLDVPDPQPGADGIQIHDGDDRSKLEAAMRACRQYSPKKDVNPNDPAIHDRGVKMAQCLRRQGLNVPDPQPGQPLEIDPGNGTDADEVKAQKAQGVCRKELNTATPAPAGSGG